MNKKYHLTSSQHKFISDNWQSQTHEQIAVKLNLSVSFISAYCVSKGYIKVKKKKTSYRPTKKIIHFGPPKKNIDRPPAEYSNVSREQHIDKWLNTKI